MSVCLFQLLDAYIVLDMCWVTCYFDYSFGVQIIRVGHAALSLFYIIAEVHPLIFLRFYAFHYKIKYYVIKN